MTSQHEEALTTALLKSLEQITSDEVYEFQNLANAIAADLNALDNAYASIKKELPTLSPEIAMELAKAKIPPKPKKLYGASNSNYGEGRTQ